MDKSMIAELLLMLGIHALEVYKKYKVTGKLELDTNTLHLLRIFSTRDEILKLYGSDMREIDEQLMEYFGVLIKEAR